MLDSYTPIVLIGEGTYGQVFVSLLFLTVMMQVYKALDKKTKTLVALKKVEF